MLSFEQGNGIIPLKQVQNEIAGNLAVAGQHNICHSLCLIGCLPVHNYIGLVGFQINSHQRMVSGMGLAGMEERAAELGGDLTINCRSGQGTSVSVEIDR